MCLIDHAAAERLHRVTDRARTDREFRPRFKTADAPAPQQGDTPEEERRSASRISMSDEILVRRVGSFSFSVALGNMSTGGCRIELVDGYSDGDDLIARLPKLEPLGAQVRWANERRAGIEFSRALHPAVFDDLVGRMKTAPSV